MADRIYSIDKDAIRLLRAAITVEKGRYPALEIMSYAIYDEEPVALVTWLPTYEHCSNIGRNPELWQELYQLRLQKLEGLHDDEDKEADRAYRLARKQTLEGLNLIRTLKRE